MGIPTGINCYGMGHINMSHGQPRKLPGKPKLPKVSTYVVAKFRT